MNLKIEWENHPDGIAERHELPALPRGQYKEQYKFKKPLKDEVAMAVPKSKQTRFVGISYNHIHYIHVHVHMYTYVCFLSSYNIMGHKNKPTSNAIIS